MDRHTWFYRGMGGVAIALVLAGFLPGLVVPEHPRQPLTWLVALHAALCVGWIALFMVQTSLVAARRLDVHRRLGVLGAVIAVALVITGYLTVVVMVRRGIALSGDPATARDPRGDAVFPLGDLVSFSVLLAAGFLWRRRRPVHVRLMLFATLAGLMPAALNHLFFYNLPLPAVPMAFTVTLPLLYGSHAIYDKVSTGRVHRLSLWGAVALVAWANIRAALIGPSDAWHRFAAWLVA